MNQIDLSIILPSYMEAKNIGSSLDQLSEWLRTHDYGHVEVIVVVADSPDGTAAIAESKAGQFDSLIVTHAGPRAGKGRDVRLGMFEATGRYRMFMDADLATPLSHLDDVKALMDHGGKVGIAVRDLVKIHKGLIRKTITGFGNLLAQIILLPGLKDTQCGFKVFEAEAAEAVFSRLTILGWGFDLEILAVARKLGYHIETFEAPDWKDPKAEGAGLVGDSPLKASIQVFRDLLTVRWNLIRGLYRQPSYHHTPGAID
ncbi:MAG TPA: glycosyltransferase [Candidatus Saccharimonas sp.]|nr:glycosyltransferase [Candidatus Saccharimonas sp.]